MLVLAVGACVSISFFPELSFKVTMCFFLVDHYRKRWKVFSKLKARLFYWLLQLS